MDLAIAYVAVRLNSKRLKRKALLSLAGKPLIVRLCERLRQSKSLSKVVICTSRDSSDDYIEDLAHRSGFPCFRGDAVDVMCRFLECAEVHPCKNILRVTGDNPLTDPSVADILLESHINKAADYTRMEGLPIGVTPEVISLQALRKAYRLAEDSSHSEYMTLYFTQNDIFNVNLVNAEPQLNRPEYRLTVDYLEDYELMKVIYKEFDFDRSPSPKLEDIISFLDRNHDLREINMKLVSTKQVLNINTKLRR